ncbi:MULTISPECIES: branched-chain amino acid transaminase [Pseudoalteromonas]|uniref:Branched-chain-amino-acid aminotransferase n=3 Tax=Pseudoalteromonas luteoviolacea TaxID=43657 RepID=A0A0F6A4B8_9GAMM|nr:MULTISPECIES: branched-chain amino acid transaminase [Pseudoalteromonas]AOT06635.1 branched chain amino acid aminotransferase [Pseudoalteromonas luteoviolacea]AOT11552.1 branched chain amino acid aminotransferase [Pseudoalteromonas luteoviolacea]AOT16465.1 branched chain amino acid aminotransferase [Pseudoalteromonas luteoviolacea]KID58975.1 branched-chain amino acid aminotransferase [Pseudoalteromonas luteoviolacea]KKE81045.1 branched-chain amino acid aminotransferase [Pseudoalteromonas lu
MTQTSELIWHNGEMIPYQEATTHVLSHALHYGSSVFEGIRAYETPNGPAIFRLDDHIQRLFDSAKIYRMEIPFTKEEIKTACKQAVKENGFSNAYLRPFAFLGHVGLGLNPKSHRADVTVAAMEWGAYLGEDSLAQGVDVCVSSWSRLAPNTMPTAAKAGGNYLSSQLISGEAKRNGYVEGIALDVNGYLSEGAGENLFVVKKGVLYTPPTTACILPGLTRDTIIHLAKERGYEVREEPIAREALYLADEFFMVGTAAEVVPVRSVDQIQVGEGQRGPITAELQQAYFDLVKGQSSDPQGWLDYVNS